MLTVDTDTGEIMLRRSFYEGLFPDDRNAAQKQVMFSRDILDGGAEHVYITDCDRVPTEDLASFWRQLGPVKKTGVSGVGSGEKRGRTGGKPGYVKFYNAEFDRVVDRLSDSDLAFLVRLSRYADWDTGALVDGSGLLTIGKIAKKMDVSTRTVENKLASLFYVGAIIAGEDNGYRLNRRCIARG